MSDLDVQNINSKTGNSAISIADDGTTTVSTFTSTGIDDNATSTAITIDANENVGIGTASPSKLLELESSDPTIRLSDTSDSTFSEISYNAGALDIDAGATSASKTTRFLRGGTESMRLDTSGNLLVGTTSPINSHTIRNAADVPLSVYRDNGASANSIAIFYSDIGGTQTARCAIRGDGDLENVNNSYGSLSDISLKENIVDSLPQLDDIMAMRVRSYNLKSTGDKHIGVIAQELEQTSPELVKTNEDGIKSVKYSIMYMKAIKALQEAVTRIETLESEVAALKGT